MTSGSWHFFYQLEPQSPCLYCAPRSHCQSFGVGLWKTNSTPLPLLLKAKELMFYSRDDNWRKQSFFPLDRVYTSSMIFWMINLPTESGRMGRGRQRVDKSIRPVRKLLHSWARSTEATWGNQQWRWEWKGKDRSKKLFEGSVNKAWQLMEYWVLEAGEIRWLQFQIWECMMPEQRKGIQREVGTQRHSVWQIYFRLLSWRSWLPYCEERVRRSLEV